MVIIECIQRMEKATLLFYNTHLFLDLDRATRRIVDDEERTQAIVQTIIERQPAVAGLCEVWADARAERVLGGIARTLPVSLPTHDPARVSHVVGSAAGEPVADRPRRLHPVLRGGRCGESRRHGIRHRRDRETRRGRARVSVGGDSQPGNLRQRCSALCRDSRAQHGEDSRANRDDARRRSTLDHHR